MTKNLHVLFFGLTILSLSACGSSSELGKGKTAFQLIMASAEQGNAKDQFTLGGMYHNGESGVAKDNAEALKWYGRSAEQGYGDGQVALGLIYAEKTGVPIRNLVTSYMWLTLGIENGTSLPVSANTLKKTILLEMLPKEETKAKSDAVKCKKNKYIGCDPASIDTLN